MQMTSTGVGKSSMHRAGFFRVPHQPDGFVWTRIIHRDQRHLQNMSPGRTMINKYTCGKDVPDGPGSSHGARGACAQPEPCRAANVQPRACASLLLPQDLRVLLVSCRSLTARCDGSGTLAHGTWNSAATGQTTRRGTFIRDIESCSARARAVSEGLRGRLCA